MNHTTINEIVVVSGKGGTGKTSLTASFAMLAKGSAVICDCDVDAADMHLLLEPQIVEQHNFYSGREAIINPAKCTACGKCAELCRFDTITPPDTTSNTPTYRVDHIGCEGCGVCVRFCPVGAIDFPDNLCGVWMRSQTRAGTMVHARLRAAAENSGKLVAHVRSAVRKRAAAEGHSLIITDGPPGIGCPLIATLSGASHILIVTEPTLSGAHDLGRLLKLIQHFKMHAYVCVNKWDLNPDLTSQIEEAATTVGATLLGRIRYDRSVTRSQLSAQSVVEVKSDAGDDIVQLWQRLQRYLNNETKGE